MSVRNTRSGSELLLLYTGLFGRDLMTAVFVFGTNMYASVLILGSVIDYRCCNFLVCHQDGQLLRKVDGHLGGITLLCPFKDEMWSGCMDRTVKCWDAKVCSLKYPSQRL